mgnify:CR=1 FL=1
MYLPFPKNGDDFFTWLYEIAIRADGATIIAVLAFVVSLGSLYYSYQSSVRAQRSATGAENANTHSAKAADAAEVSSQFLRFRIYGYTINPDLRATLNAALKGLELLNVKSSFIKALDDIELLERVRFHVRDAALGLREDWMGSDAETFTF